MRKINKPYSKNSFKVSIHLLKIKKILYIKIKKISSLKLKKLIVKIVRFLNIIFSLDFVHMSWATIEIEGFNYYKMSHLRLLLLIISLSLLSLDSRPFLTSIFFICSFLQTKFLMLIFAMTIQTIFVLKMHFFL